jgi:hypothetical protein
VLKHHDTGGSEITASLKHVYGILSMSDGQSSYRHYSGLGETCGKMVVSIRPPVLNIIDAIWVSHNSLKGYPANTTFRANQILASQDPVALDYWAAKYILYPIDNNPRHHPDFAGIQQWLTGAHDIINGRGGIYNPDTGILLDMVTKNEAAMQAHVGVLGNLLGDLNNDGIVDISDVILELRIALGIDPQVPCSDINGDGVVDISDVILTLRMALGLDEWQICTG